jgi:hypothetical protein
MKRSIVTGIIVVVVAVIAFFVGCKTSIEKPMQTSFPGAEKHEITLSDAVKYVQNFRKTTPTPEINGGTFDRGAIDKILAQPGCASLRIYYGRDENGKPNLVLVGVDAVGKDMTKNTIMERQAPCPPYCDSESELLK